MKARETEIETGKLIREAQAIEEDNQRKHQYLRGQMVRKLERTKKLVQEVETYRDTLLQKLQHLAEDILIRSQVIERNIQRNVDNDEGLK